MVVKINIKNNIPHKTAVNSYGFYILGSGILLSEMDK